MKSLKNSFTMNTIADHPQNQFSFDTSECVIIYEFNNSFTPIFDEVNSGAIALTTLIIWGNI